MVFSHSNNISVQQVAENVIMNVPRTIRNSVFKNVVVIQTAAGPQYFY